MDHGVLCCFDALLSLYFFWMYSSVHDDPWTMVFSGDFAHCGQFIPWRPLLPDISFGFRPYSIAPQGFVHDSATRHVKLFCTIVLSRREDCLCDNSQVKRIRLIYDGLWPQSLVRADLNRFLHSMFADLRTDLHRWEKMNEMNEWLTDWMTEWIELMNEWMNEWKIRMNEWIK